MGGFNPADPEVMRQPPRPKNEPLISNWVFFRYMVVGLYVGFATVGVFGYWYVSYDWAGEGHQHDLITYAQLSHFTSCKFENGKWAGKDDAYEIFKDWETNPPSSKFCDTTASGYSIDGGDCVAKLAEDPCYYLHS